MFGIFRGQWPSKSVPSQKETRPFVMADSGKPCARKMPEGELKVERPRTFAGQIASVGTQSREEYEEAKTRAIEGHLSIRWIAAFLDGSGYAEAARNYVAALSTVGVDVLAKAVSYEDARSDHGRSWHFVKPALGRTGGYLVNVVDLTPDHYQFFRDPYAYNIGYFAWETDILPEEWIDQCNSMNEIWVPCSWTAQVARKSGVKAPVRVFGHCCSTDDYEDGPVLSIPEIDPGWFKFYSVFQWTERKHPRGLLEAYLRTFTNKDPVILILKAYRCNYSEEEQAIVVSEIEKIKRDVGGSKQPRILAILGMMTRKEILALHRSCDCFVLFQRAEGWGLPHFEACMMGKPVITTGYGGNLEFTTKDHSYLLRHGMIPVQGMDWIPWYRPNMSWADPDLSQGSILMKYVYKHRQEAAAKGMAARKHVRENFSWEMIGSRMKSRIADFAGMK